MKIKYGEDNAEYWKVSWYLVNGVHEESLNIGKAWRKSLKRAKRASLTRLLARTWIRKKTVLQSILDLLQVDLLASGASLVWPRSGRPRATKSREVVPAIWNPTKDFFESLQSIPEESFFRLLDFGVLKKTKVSFSKDFGDGNTDLKKH